MADDRFRHRTGNEGEDPSRSHHARRLVVLNAPGRDEELRDELYIHLRPLEELVSLTIWHDGLVPPGLVKPEMLLTQTRSAIAIVILVTADLLALQDDDDGVRLVLTCAFVQSTWLFPILARPCMYESARHFRHQMMVVDGKPVMSHDDRDHAWAKVAHVIGSELSTARWRAIHGASPAFHFASANEYAPAERASEVSQEHLDDAREMVGARQDPSALTLLRAVEAFYPCSPLTSWAEELAGLHPSDSPGAWEVLSSVRLVDHRDGVARLSSPRMAMKSPALRDDGRIVGIVLDWVQSTDPVTFLDFLRAAPHVFSAVVRRTSPGIGAHILSRLAEVDDEVVSFCRAITAYEWQSAEEQSSAQMLFATIIPVALKLDERVPFILYVRREVLKHCPSLYELT